MELLHYLRCISFILLFVSKGLFSYSQEVVNLNPSKRITQFPVKSWDMDKGMPSDMVIGITQCNDGYIWLATYKGIARFDGVNFTTYNYSSSDAIQSVTIQSLTKDSEGNLWFASQRGLVKFSNNTFSRDPNLIKLNNISVEALFFDNNTSSLWIGTTSDGVFRYKSMVLEEMTAFREISKGVVKSIISDKSGNIWFGTEGGNLVKYNDDGFEQVEGKTSPGGIASFYSNNKGEVWIAAEQGVFKIEKNKLIFCEDIKVDRVSSIIEDNHNTLWIGSESGLYRYHINTRFLDHINEDKGLSNNLIKDLFVDNESSLWVATYRKGIQKFTDGLITNFSENEGLSSDLITSIVQVDENTFYVGDEYGNVNVLKDDQISQLKFRTEISNDRLKSLYFDSKRNLWISTYGGLIKLEPNGREHIFKQTKNFPAETVRLTYEDNEGNIWIGTRSNGLFKLTQNGKFKEFSLKNGFSSNYIMSISQDINGRIVVATKNGINIIQNDQVVKIIDIESGLPSNFAFNVHIDSDNIYWVASNDGIFRIENDTSIFVFEIQNGLFDNTLFDILEDDSGNFWMPTDIGIAFMSKKELNDFAKAKIDKYSFRIFGRSDGMKKPRCFGATKSLKATDGRLLFTTSGGVSILDPSDVVDEKLSFKVLIENVVVNGGVKLQPKDFIVPPGSNRVQINYTAINLSNPEKIRFRYKLEPFDVRWIEAGNQRFAQYTNVPPGNYTFSVQASSNAGEWSHEAITTSIIVKRIWWKTWWFRIVLAFVMSFILWLIYKARMYSVKLQKIELERLVEERTALINQQKRELEIQSVELEKLSIVASHTINAVMMTSSAGRILWVNDSFTSIYGYTLDEFIAEYGSNLAKVSHDPNIRYVIEKCINEKKTTQYTVEVRTKDGSKLWIQTTLTPIKNEDGSVRVIVAIDTDITELKQVENEMISLNNEIMQQTEAMRQQKEEIQTQRDELEQVNNLLFKHNQNIESSIWYAHTIQKAILPSKSNIDKFFEHFVVFKPRDIVSGDFYWFNKLPGDAKQPERFIVAVVDCTGHGVPGALMSMIGSRLISEIVNERNIYDPAMILVELNKLVNIVLKQETEDNIDGMDIALCYIEKSKNNNYSIVFSGANRPVYILRKGSEAILTIKGNRKTIGGIMPDLDAEFQNHSFNLNQGDMLILNSDGYIDQNGEDARKLSVLRFHSMILEKADRPMVELGEFLDVSFDVYRGKQSQRDDATVLGLRF